MVVARVADQEKETHTHKVVSKLWSCVAKVLCLDVWGEKRMDVFFEPDLRCWHSRRQLLTAGAVCCGRRG